MTIVPEILWAAMEGGHALAKGAARLGDANTLTKLLAASTAIGAVYYSGSLLSDLHCHGQTPMSAPSHDSEPYHWRNMMGAGAIQLAESDVPKNRGR